MGNPLDNQRGYDPHNPHNPMARGSTERHSGRFSWWYRLTAPPEPAIGADFNARERHRRARLASVILLGYMVTTLIALPIGLSDPSLVTLKVLVVALLLDVAVALLNRVGRVNTAGLLMVALPILVLGAIVVVNVDTSAPLLYTPIYDLLALSLLIAAALLPPPAVFLVALTNSAFIVLDSFLILLPPKQWAALTLTSDDVYAILARPIAFQVIVAIVAFLSARSVLDAIKRADRAEELAELERRELEQQRELEEGARQLLAVHVHLANGDFSVRSPAIRNPLLWQIGSSLNTLIARLGRMAQADFVLRRTQEESQRLTEALMLYNSGRQPIWPVPSNTPLDRVVEAIRTTLARGSGQLPQIPAGGPPAPPTPRSYAPPAPPSQPRPPLPASALQPPQQQAAQPPAGGQSETLPEWLRPLLHGPVAGQAAEPPAMSSEATPRAQAAAPPPQQGGRPAGPTDAVDTVEAEANLPEWLRPPRQ